LGADTLFTMETGSESSPAVLAAERVSFFPGFKAGVGGAAPRLIPYVIGGSGPPLLLLHGHPQSLIIWRKVAPALSQHFTVVATDLCGYGDAGKPEGGQAHVAYSKRAMAQDQAELMGALGFERFSVLAHDRGARVAHRLGLDHEHRIRRMVLLDICPTLAMYEQTSMMFASAYWHWFFLIQPAPFPETLINAQPDFYLEKLMGLRSAGLSPFEPRAWAQYQRHMRDPDAVHAMCEDYRAAAGIDLEHDRADRDAGRKLAMPLAVYWGLQGVIEKCFDPLSEWARVAHQVQGQALACGHYIPEEAPQAVLDHALPFLKD
jgi:haloacetate dehalogenase